MPRYTAQEHGWFVEEVWLNGEEIAANTFRVDTDEGWADCFMRDGDGKLIPNDDGTGVKAERLFGDIRVVLRDDR